MEPTGHSQDAGHSRGDAHSDGDRHSDGDGPEGTTQRPGEPRLIKRYANRKLYDTRDSRYVTLVQIADYVRDGEHVTIIDNKTKEDLTNVTLAQIVYEEEKKGSDAAAAVSVNTLRGMIQQSGERLMTSLREGPVGKLIAKKDGDSTPPPAIEAEPPPTEAKDKDRDSKDKDKESRRSVFKSSKEALDELQRLADDRMRGLLGHAITHVQQLQSEVGRLQARIEELEDRLVKLNRRKGDETDEPDETTD